MIRFDQSNERPCRNRRRSQRGNGSEACDYCRKRKSKCDGLQPVCSVCQLFKKPCTYGNVKKRGMQSGYVRGLESLLGLVMEHIPGSEMRIRTLLRNDYADASFVDGEFLLTVNSWTARRTDGAVRSWPGI